MKKLLFLLSVMGVLFVTSCSTVRVSANYDKNVDFKQYKTFTLLPWNPHNDSIVSPFTRDMILNALKTEMIKRGYKYVPDLKDADLGVNTYILAKKKTDYQYYTDYYGHYGYYYGYPWAWYGPVAPPYYGTSVTARDYIEGTIIIDVFDTHKKKLIWQGVGVGELDPLKPATEKKVNRIISQIMYKYPVRYQ